MASEFSFAVGTRVSFLYSVSMRPAISGGVEICFPGSLIEWLPGAGGCWRFGCIGSPWIVAGFLEEDQVCLHGVLELFGQDLVGFRESGVAES